MGFNAERQNSPLQCSGMEKWQFTAEKNFNISVTGKIERELLLTAYIKSYTAVDFWQNR